MSISRLMLDAADARDAWVDAVDKADKLREKADEAVAAAKEAVAAASAAETDALEKRGAMDAAQRACADSAVHPLGHEAKEQDENRMLTEEFAKQAWKKRLQASADALRAWSQPTKKRREVV